jgi:hypothetical protein
VFVLIKQGGKPVYMTASHVYFECRKGETRGLVYPCFSMYLLYSVFFFVGCFSVS